MAVFNPAAQQVLRDVAGAGVERADLVAVGILRDVEAADGPMGLPGFGSRIAVGEVVADLRLHRAVDRGGLGLVRDVVDAAVALAEAVGAGAGSRGVVRPGRGDQPVEVVSELSLSYYEVHRRIFLLYL
jgi:hypothetical protein